jgi:hypothetical protein
LRRLAKERLDRASKGHHGLHMPEDDETHVDALPPPLKRRS